ncbi:MAG TPA: M23 family metallopeptidase [Candidatus Caenarcaniphilales bacterium]|nr:M23 family metallopeptidase [Candidatus Caenarcaniphilales bacterium]
MLSSCERRGELAGAETVAGKTLNRASPRVAIVVVMALSLFVSAPVHAQGPTPTLTAPVETTAPATTRPGHGFFRWPTGGHLTQNYGCTGFQMNQSRGRCRFFHNGIDIANARGTHVVAAATGVVTFVGWDPYDRSNDRAWIVVVRHSGGLRSWYAHLLPKRVSGARVGDRVRRGQLIGYMGETGKATGVHLHFMAQYRGSFVNPRRFLGQGDQRPPRHMTSVGLRTHASAVRIRPV